jgi:hypothetical protein
MTRRALPIRRTLSEARFYKTSSFGSDNCGVFGAIAGAQTTSNGTLTLSGQLDGSIALFFFSDSSGYAFAADGLANEAVSIGDVSAYGTPNTLLANNFTKAMDSDGFHLSTPFLLQVKSANGSSTPTTLAVKFPISMDSGLVGKTISFAATAN